MGKLELFCWVGFRFKGFFLGVVFSRGRELCGDFWFFSIIEFSSIFRRSSSIIRISIVEFRVIRNIIKFGFGFCIFIVFIYRISCRCGRFCRIVVFCRIEFIREVIWRSRGVGFFFVVEFWIIYISWSSFFNVIIVVVIWIWCVIGIFT